MKDPNTSRQYFNCRSTNTLKRIRLFLKGANFYSSKALSFLFSFKQIFDTCLSNLRGYSYGGQLARLSGLARLGEISASLKKLLQKYNAFI